MLIFKSCREYYDWLDLINATLFSWVGMKAFALLYFFLLFNQMIKNSRCKGATDEKALLIEKVFERKRDEEDKKC